MIYQVVRNRERAKDLAQDTFAKAFTKLDSYRPERKFRPWILTIAHNTALKYVERRRVDSLDSQFVVTPGQVDEDAMRSLSASETPTPMPHPDAAGLGAAIEALRPKYRRCIKLLYVEQRSYDDIADLMHVPRETVCNWLNRARKELKEAFPIDVQRKISGLWSAEVFAHYVIHIAIRRRGLFTIHDHDGFGLGRGPGGCGH